VNQEINRPRELPVAQEEPIESPIDQGNQNTSDELSSYEGAIDTEPYADIDEETVPTEEIVRIPASAISIGPTVVPHINRLQLPSGVTSFRIEPNVPLQTDHPQREHSANSETQANPQYVTRHGRNIRPMDRFQPY